MALWALLGGCQLLSGLTELETRGAAGATDAASDGALGADASLVDVAVTSDGASASDGAADSEAAPDSATGDAADATWMPDADAHALDGGVDASDATLAAVDAGNDASLDAGADVVDAAAPDAGQVLITVTVAVRPGASLTSLSIDGVAVCTGAACDGVQSRLVAAGKTVPIHAVPAANNDAHFSGALCKGTSDCVFVADSAKATALTVVAQNYVFVTSATHDGNFGALDPAAGGNGLAGADALCNSLAAAAGLPGAYVAWLSTPEVTALSRIAAYRGWINVLGQPVFDNPVGAALDPGIADGEMFNAVGYTELGGKIATASHEFVFTGTNGDGTLAPNNFISNGHCDRWTSGGELAGQYGFAWHGTRGFTDYDIRVVDKQQNEQRSCKMPGRLYCFGKNHSGVGAKVVIPPPPAVSRRAFLSKGVSTPAGAAAFDTLCQNEASAAGLAGSFSALLSTTAQSAFQRVPLFADVSRGGFFRRDGVAVFSNGSALAQNVPAVSAALTQHADGTYLQADLGDAWTGIYNFALSPSPPGDVQFASYTCQDWSLATGSYGALGRASAVAPEMVRAAGVVGLRMFACDYAAHVYCLER